MRGIVENYDAGMAPTRSSPFYLDASMIYIVPQAISFVAKYAGRYLLQVQGAGGNGVYNTDGYYGGGGGGGYAERIVVLRKGYEIVGTLPNDSSATILSAVGFTLYGGSGGDAQISSALGGAGGIGSGGTLNLRGGKGSNHGSDPAGSGEGLYGGAGGTPISSAGAGGGSASNSGFLRGERGFDGNISVGTISRPSGGGRGGSGAYPGSTGTNRNYGSSGGVAIIYIGP